MTNAVRLSIPLLAAAILAAAGPSAPAPPDSGFGERRTLGLVGEDAIDEASGLAASRLNPGLLWLHNDSGGDPVLWVMDRAGDPHGRFLLAGAKNVDWEDMAIGPGPRPGRHYLYVGDIGDNRARRKTITVYRVLEPVPDPRAPAGVDTLRGVAAIVLRYPDGPRDAEALLVDPASNDIVIVSKREQAVGVYRAPYPQPVGRATTLERVATLPLSTVTGGDWSPDGGAILLKTYLGISLWRVERGDDLAAVFAREPVALPYFPEPQGEAVAWDPQRGGYYTVSEERQDIPAYLYYYPLLEASAD